jgi:hypothetical protein
MDAKNSTPFPSNLAAPLGPNNQFSRVWMDFFVALFRRTGAEAGFDPTAIQQAIDGLLSSVGSLEAEVEAVPPGGASLGALMEMIAQIEAQTAQMLAAASQPRDEFGEAGDASQMAALLERIERLESQSGMAGARGATDTRLDDIEALASGGMPRQVDAVTSVAGRDGDVTLEVADVSGAAPSASPTLTGAVAVGDAGNTNTALYVAGALGGAGTSQYGVQSTPEFNGSATGSCYTYLAAPRLKSTSFVAGNVYGFLSSPPTVGAGASITNFEQFIASNFSTATGRIAGFRMKVASGTNKWNIYADGTAANYFAGTMQIGSATDDGSGNKIQCTTGISIAPATTTTAPSAGGAGALPATPTGYATVRIGGTDRKVAYY